VIRPLSPDDLDAIAAVFDGPHRVYAMWPGDREG
jgi:hypothetical protein